MADSVTKPPATNAPPSPPARLPIGFIFSMWKGLLLVVALIGAVGSSYDTSTELLFASAAAAYTDDDGDIPTHKLVTVMFESVPIIGTLVSQLTRWDALYFVKSAQRGYLFEQEWAFGIGQPTIVATLLQGCNSMAINLGVHVDGATAAMGIVVSIAAHLYAVHALYALVVLLSGNKRLAYVSAVLHIFSPAGMFLVAPYSEAPFAYLAFTGLLRYAETLALQRGSWERVKKTLWAGVLLGLATACRSNGLLYGLVFALDLLEALSGFASAPSKVRALVSLIATGLAGVFVGLGSLLPQLAGYRHFCQNTLGDAPEWCDYLVPSIYNHVQSRYWNVGFLRYWTPGNIPLFALAAPMLYILVVSSHQTLSASPTTKTSRSVCCPAEKSPYSTFVKSLALGQVILAFLALTSYHVQIITRLASGYPLWYIWTAEQLSSSKDVARMLTGRKIVSYMVAYALIQGLLYVSFLPPA
ncbi:hypothetical protein TD95_003952 [Thielaviopsis punctulata]|uniref:GPI mannosyltransferase 2 n=1 Tax=Thielaviopsis punctulata TaxID=72032 RepID=A0A0F4ZB05_9PEZI|nr:hypothetical protein TD95_003952 [Thielaviopsis punctulata]